MNLIMNRSIIRIHEGERIIRREIGSARYCILYHRRNHHRKGSVGAVEHRDRGPDRGTRAPLVVQHSLLLRRCHQPGYRKVRHRRRRGLSV